MQLTPLIAVHLTAALAATVIGPIALWARLGRRIRPQLHRRVGYAWVTLMLLAACTALGIRDFNLPNIAGYTLIHLLIPITFLGIGSALWALHRGRIRQHQLSMQWTYIGGCVIAGVLTLLPSRLLGSWLWGLLA